MSFDAEACLAYDPFAGDFGSPGDRLLADKIVVAAKAHEHCHSCDGPIAKGERHRSRREIVDGEMMAHRFCGLCCAAMAISWDDDGEAIEARTNMHPAFAHLRIDDETQTDNGPKQAASEGDNRG